MQLQHSITERFTAVSEVRVKLRGDPIVQVDTAREGWKKSQTAMHKQEQQHRQFRVYG